jgi:hypothetical protein
LEHTWAELSKLAWKLGIAIWYSKFIIYGEGREDQALMYPEE